MEKFVGVIILESLVDETLLADVTVLDAKDVPAPAGDPYPIWSQRLIELPAEEAEKFAQKLALRMKEDFYNHFFDDRDVFVVFKEKYFRLPKNDKEAWKAMIEYGKTVRVGPEYTENIPFDRDKLL